MQRHNPYAQYREVAVETATPLRLVIMLYDGALRFLNQALPAMRARDYETQSRTIGKAQAIIAHLRATLDHEAGGEVARTLDRFYVAAFDTLTRANIDDRTDKVENVLFGLRELREAWVDVDRLCQAGKSAPERIAA